MTPILISVELPPKDKRFLGYSVKHGWNFMECAEWPSAPNDRFYFEDQEIGGPVTDVTHWMLEPPKP
jgi:hypothetical protein